MNRSIRVILAALLLAGCSSTTGPDHDGLLLQTLRAEQKWLANGPPAYSMVAQRACECTIQMAGPVRMEIVREGRLETIMTMVYHANGEPVSPAYVDGFHSVRGLFDRIREAARADAAEIRVTFHPTLGYPTSIFIDYHAEMVDDEVLYRVDSLQPLTDAALSTH